MGRRLCVGRSLKNGLDDAENRELFSCDDPSRAAALLRSGLRKRYP
ncbi:MAG: hypothetical protein KC486_09790 [Myxococcales bacterium]|nr:hypothetical protein [Myxococcales bacterium]